MMPDLGVILRQGRMFENTVEVGEAGLKGDIIRQHLAVLNTQYHNVLQIFTAMN
jgi:hypothetical protein